MRVILIISFIILAFVNYRYLDINLLGHHSIDEVAFHGSLVNMYKGLTNLDIKLFFSFLFYNYGFGFFFLNLLATIPFFLMDNIEMTIYIPRLVTSFFAVATLYVVYKVSRDFIDKHSSVLISLIVVSMPGFWRNAFWFHPDWMMTFFIALSVYFFTKDRFEYKKCFWWAIISLGMAVSLVKIQAVTYLPLLFLYIFYENFQNKHLQELKTRALLFIKGIVLILVMFIFLNPYILSKKGIGAFWFAFSANIESNATNHSSNIHISILDKLYYVIHYNYLNIFLFLVVVCLWVMFSLDLFRYCRLETG